ncbi:MAG: terminase large subunit [Candidatus Hydrogenedentes bacterium]|nr:terminase large subunit [Candidatus Hydrogenedentota bacterium]
MIDAPLMPPHDAPFKAKDVRDLYRKGTWAYALGKPAWTHPKYKQVVEIAKRGRKGQPSFNPWWLRNWGDVEATLAGCWMDEPAGRNVANFYSLLRHFEGELAGQPFMLSDWQSFDITIPVFGWKRPNATRRFRQAYVEIPKKQGKTTWAAGTQAYMLVGDGEEGAENYTAATDREQSGVMYRAFYEMARSSPSLSKILEFVPSRYRIVYHPTASFYRSMSSKSSSAHGLKPYFIGLDETHVFPNPELYDALLYGGRARRQPLVMSFTTAGVYDPTSLGWRLHEQAERVRNGEAYTDWSFFAYVCGLTKDEEPEWHTPAMCVKTNPSVGITFQVEDDQEVIKRIESDPAEESNSKRLLRNIWTAQMHAWMPMGEWDACAGEYTEDDLADLVCYGGLDLSQSQDITAFVLWFPPQAGCEKHQMLCRFWVPEEQVAKFDVEYSGMYSVWIKQGHLRTTPGRNIDQEYIRAEINALREKHAIRTIGYDKAFAGKLATDLETTDGFDVGPFQQGAGAMNEPVTGIMRLVLDRALEHPNNPVLNWHISNCQAAKDGGGRTYLVKNSKGGRGKAQVHFKIDGVHAMCMGYGTSLLDPVGVFDAAELIR